MTTLTVVYWRDIPAQVIARAGRKSVKKMLPDRFQEAIDLAAMRAGAATADEYLEDWHKGEPTPVDGDLDAAAETLARELDQTWTPDKLNELVASVGRTAD
jgi:hypothetical protein